MNERYTILLNQSLCSGMGDCARLAPDVFDIGADGLAVVMSGSTDDPAVLDAVRACPMAALSAFREASGEQVA